MRRLFITLAMLVSALSSFAEASTTDRPNVILIYADDLGIGMLGCYGQKLVETPHIDRLANEGIKFSNYYGGVLCAPARWTLLTGMHDGRLGGWKFNEAGLLIQLDEKKTPDAAARKALDKYVEKSSDPIPENEVFLAQIAQKAGYKTAQFGKLDVGFLTNHDRLKRFGWDFYEGYYSHKRCHGFYPPYLWRNGEKFTLEGNPHPDCAKMSEKGNDPVGSGGETYSQNVFIEGILNYIRSHKNESFFLHHPTQLPHGPVAIPQIHPDFANNKKLSLAEKKYASMVKMLDDHVGLIMQELKTQGIDQNTIVVFTSDNGHEMYYGPKGNKHKKLANGQKANLTDKKWRTSNGGDVFDGAGGRAGVKRAAYQGGMQCPLIVRWPGKIASNTASDHMATHYDFMATMADLLNVGMPKGKDGVSYLPTLLAKPQKETHDYVIINNGFNHMGRTALIARDGWKLIEVDRKKNQFQLYNIKEDNEERHDLAKKYPERVSNLKAILLSEIDSARPDLK